MHYFMAENGDVYAYDDDQIAMGYPIVPMRPMTAEEIEAYLHPAPTPAEVLAAMKAELAARNAQAVTQIARIQDRINTIGYGIEAGEATEEDEAEQAALMISIAAWKSYKFALGKVTKQPGWFAAPIWPVTPEIPVIIADPQAQTPQAS